MKSNRTWLPVLALAALSFLASAAAHALPDCNNELICNCGKACSTRCSPGPGLPTLSCGEWGYDCNGSPNCNLFKGPSSESTHNASSVNSALQRIFSSVPAEASVNR